MKIKLVNHGTLVMAYPVDDAAAQWLRETAPEDAQFLGRALAIEPRYALGFADTFEAAGGEIV